MIYDHKVDIILIQEDKMNKHKFDKVVVYIWKVDKYAYNKVFGAYGRISTMWNPSKLSGLNSTITLIFWLWVLLMRLLIGLFSICMLLIKVGEIAGLGGSFILVGNIQD